MNLSFRFHFLGIVSTLALGVLAGCAAPTDNPSASDQDIVSGTRVAFPMTATLGDVTAGHATGGAEGLWTNIDLKYEVPCDQKFESFSYALRTREDGRVDLLASGVGSRDKNPSGVRCMSIMLQTKTVTVPGIVSKDDINLVNLEGPSADLAATTKSLEPIGVEIADLRSLCPPGAMCIQGGTVVTLRVTKPVSCIDKIAPVSYAVEQADGKVKLAASAIDMVDSRQVLCIATPKTVEITLPGVIATKDNLDFTSVGGAPAAE